MRDSPGRSAAPPSQARDHRRMVTAEMPARGGPALGHDMQPVADGLQLAGYRGSEEPNRGAEGSEFHRWGDHEYSIANQAHSFRRTNIGHRLPAVKKASQLLCRPTLTT